MTVKLFIRSFSNQKYSHVHDFNQIVIPIKGSADNFTDKGDGRIGPGQSIVFPAGCEHRFVPDEQSKFLVSESIELPSSLQSLSHPIIAIPPQVLHFCYFVEKQVGASTSPYLYENIGKLFFDLLEEQEFRPRIDTRIVRVLDILEADIASSPSLSELASIACLSVSQLKNLFKKEIGKNITQHLLALRMDKAQALLTHTDYPVSIIATMVGYQDTSAFSHRFSAYFGHSPRKSRQQTQVAI